MLIESGVLIGVYAGISFFKQRMQKNKKSTPPDTPIENEKKTKYNNGLERFTGGKTADDIDKDYNIQLKVSTVNVAIAALRQFFFVPLALIYLGFLSFTTYRMFHNAEKSIRKKKIGSDVFSSVFTLLGVGMGQYFPLALGNWLYILGCKMVAKTQQESQNSIREIFEQLPARVWVLKDDIETEISLDELRANDIVVVSAGEVIPIDGVITCGMAMIDQHALTGEAQPVEKEPGAYVFASTFILSGRICVRIEKSGFETTFYKVNEQLNRTANFKTQLQLRSEDMADRTALPFMAMWLLTTGFVGASQGLVVMSSNFGNRFRVIAPLVILNYLKLASHRGILIKDGRSIEGLNQVDTVLFDKTGTLTEEIPEVDKIIPFDGHDKEELLLYAAAAECKVSHPIAKAILKKASEFRLVLPGIEDSMYKIGYGITVSLRGKTIRVGSSRFMSIEGFSLPCSIEKSVQDSHARGNSLVIVAVNQDIIGAIELQVVIRPEVKSIISGLRQRGIKHIAIVSGDHRQPTQRLAESLGVDSYFYDVLPSEKSDIVTQLQKQGKYVCFVGDGINDTVAMKKANVSISLTGASAIAVDIAEVILMDGTLTNLCDLLDISKNLDIHLKKSLAITLVPTFISIAGLILFNISFITAFTIKNMIFLASAGYAMLPSKKNGSWSNNGYGTKLPARENHRFLTGKT